MNFPRIEEIPYTVDSALLFEQISDMQWPVFLDSGGSSRRGRFDLLAANPFTTLVTCAGETVITEGGETHTSADDPFDLLRQAMSEQQHALGALPFEGGAIGYFGYDLARLIEKLPEKAQDIDQLPEMMVGIYDWAVIVDHELGRSWLVGQGRSEQTAAEWPGLLERLRAPGSQGNIGVTALRALQPFESSVTKAEYLQALKHIHNYINAGDCYQVNYTQRFAAPVEGDAWQAYVDIRKQNAIPYAAFMRLDEIEILSFSPERFLRLSGNRVVTEPIKGTRPRGESTSADLALQDELYNSSKDRAENLMIVDLLRNDLGRVCQPGTIHVKELFHLESFPTVHHLVSRIGGELREGEDALSLLRASFPGGSITGAPKIRAMEVIEELEPYRRGIYCGSIGYIGFNGNMDTSITIRTMVHRSGQAHYWVGGGIVADSDPDEEYQECLDKAAVFRRFFDS
ncbi:aminodeoxychorismate synthase component I [Solemya elarraichensis gill symbiont]|uniref:aminodeoxychorismate synthase n=1 Tax=Solemya elarraichensis gill symbiont TaxID=1918949 RepID=A0A1T2L9S0_9GAMM|nr:aminodeoxychorismate synthase component I [Solemya elarraichensis gill symbiont]OOZ41772.1 aminodeoxychorismate synthase, component I [Solemya elarraichensis gill symbiont]